MTYKESQKHLIEARDCLNMVTPNAGRSNKTLLRSIASSLLVIASVVADIEFKDEEER